VSIDFARRRNRIASCSPRLFASAKNQENPAGETGREAGAEGATAPETLRQKDRRGMKLWKAAARHRRGGSPTE
jgi:hypothetical protein